MSPTALEEWGQRIAAQAIPIEDIKYGPWAGSMESRTADRIPREFVVGASSTDFLYRPKQGTWKRRGGQSVKFDTLSNPPLVGLLPAKWSGRVRQVEEFTGPAVTDGIPTVMALSTKETVSSGLDDGAFSQVWWRDQVGTVNRQMCSEFGTDVYAATPGTAQSYRVVPLWHESGDGTLTRGVSEFQRRLLVGGSRRFARVGNWWYFPSLKGTPSRWNGGVAGTVVATQASSVVQNTSIQINGAGNAVDALATSDGETYIIYRDGQIVGTYSITLGLAASLTGNEFVVNYNARRSDTVPDMTYYWQVCRADGYYAVSPTYTVDTTQALTYADFTSTVDSGWTPGNGTGHQTPNSITLVVVKSGSGGISGYLAVSYLRVDSGEAVAGLDRLIPSGPLPPTHAGTLAKGNVIEGGSTIANTFNPTSDVAAGAWVTSGGATSNLYTAIDEESRDDLDYIQTPANSNTTCEFALENPGFTPAAGSIVVVRFAARKNSGLGVVTLTVSLVDATDSDTIFSYSPVLTDTVTNYTYTLADGEIADISNWNNIQLKFVTTNALLGGYAQVTWAQVTYAPSASAAEGSWRGRDRFLYSVAYRFEDGSVWMPCTPRLPSSDLTNGYNMFTVNSSATDAQYDFITWSNIPIGPHGVVGRLLLRSLKVDSTVTGDELKLNPFDLRLVAELTDNTTTTYVDYQADDFGLGEDSAGLIIRHDHLMPPRSRYVAGGDMRVAVGYGGQNPCAIVIAPVGKGDDNPGGVPTYDLNLTDSSSTAYASHGSFMRYRLETDGNATLRLIQGDGATATNSLPLDMDDYPTLQKLVDKINSTTFAVHGMTWRAQLCPGANPSAPSKTCLTPHVREIASVVSTSGTATLAKAAGGLSVVGVGTFISKTNVPAGTYVIRIDSDTQLTMSANATGTSTDTATFYSDTGDTAITGEVGWQRVIANSLPGFLYFNESYLDDDPIKKDTVWMTTATPGSVRSAANNFSGKTANRFAPPTHGGIVMGIGAVDQGFVVPYSGAVYALRNTRDSSSGIDEDYKLVELNGARGCCAWNTVTPGSRFVPYLTPDGMCAADLEREVLLSEWQWDQSTATGSLSYEIPQSIAATARDNDSSYAYARVMRGAIWLNYRTSTSTTHPNRQVVYDFSGGISTNGLAALVRDEPLESQDGRTIVPAGALWGWSVPLVRSFTAMVEARRDDGSHLYGWNDANAGSTGDGRIDEFETGSTDNGTAITATLLTPWERLDNHYKLSAQEIVIEHAAPSGATVLLDFHRGYNDATYTLTPSTTSLVIGREIKLLPQAARTATEACYMGYRQTAGTAAELRALTLRAKRLRSYT